MTRPHILIGRRGFLIGLLAAPTLPAGASARRDFATRLDMALSNLPSGRVPAKLTAVSFAPGPDTFSAVVRLDWPPGMRKRRFVTTGETQEDAFSRLLAELETYFTKLV